MGITPLAIRQSFCFSKNPLIAAPDIFAYIETDFRMSLSVSGLEKSVSGVSFALRPFCQTKMTRDSDKRSKNHEIFLDNPFRDSIHVELPLHFNPRKQE